MDFWGGGPGNNFNSFFKLVDAWVWMGVYTFFPPSFPKE